MFEFPNWLRTDAVRNFFDLIVEFILDYMGGFFDLIRSVTLSFFNGAEWFLAIIPWWLYIILIFFAAFKLYNWVMAVTLSTMTLAIGIFGLWNLMITTLAIILIAVLLSVIIGVPVGILMAKKKRIQSIFLPILDGMQTMPSFVYLIPAVMLFGLGRVPAIFATIIYALPPLIRLTFLGIKNVNKDVIEAGLAFGSTKRQMLFKIELPQAISTIMTGINQTTMMSVSMVVIAAMIGAPGIGEEVLTAIRRIEIGQGFQAGLAIVFLAIILDRILQGFAKKYERQGH